ncbi:ubiquinone anaerobic biosynthesis accessory factor UbiT [Pseudomarimonas arenosa]|uniref:SCP2 sterol-binding domain-containing protein n=1 Tax=Pseudomarimonas arenosa TaxID=2774145 RepID=A0AAW3ZKD4_9GAMM|nr:SCP2 sterol-binding domain-containing protein [Pseudomarimonas arenosa]MBD8526208.1 SCP2 sterol-binding domain-containing protein [Pseudomarimonas arenosa]
MALTSATGYLPLGVRWLRWPIDLTDAAMRRLLCLRTRLVAPIRYARRCRGLNARDATREALMRRRAALDAQALGLAADQAEALLNLSLQVCRAPATDKECVVSEHPVSTFHRLRDRLLARLPPPTRWAPLLARLPRPWLDQLSQPLLQRAMAASLSGQGLQAIEGRWLAIEAEDLSWRIVVRVRNSRIELLPSDQPAEASVRGSVTDLLLLASRLEDADTLFFQRRLQLTGNVELGLCARNLLDQLRWEDIPLSLRIPLNRLARLARRARDAHRQRLAAQHDAAAHPTASDQLCNDPTQP